MGRMLVGAALGLVATFLTIMLVEWAGHVLYPLPEGLDPAQPAELARLIASRPGAALAAVVFAWTFGAFVGGYVAGLVAGPNRPRLAAMLPALMVVGNVAMIVRNVPHPQWMSLLGLLLPIPAALLAATQVENKLRRLAATRIRRD